MYIFFVNKPAIDDGVNTLSSPPLLCLPILVIILIK